VWAAEAPNTRNEAFNLTNGDLFTLHDAFPIAAEAFGMETTAPHRFDIVEELRALAHLWPGMIDRYGLDMPRDLDAVLGESLTVGASWTAMAASSRSARRVSRTAWTPPTCTGDICADSRRRACCRPRHDPRAPPAGRTPI